MSPRTPRALSTALLLAVVTAPWPSPRVTPPAALPAAMLRGRQVNDTRQTLSRSGLTEAVRSAGLEEPVVVKELTAATTDEAMLEALDRFARVVAALPVDQRVVVRSWPSTRAEMRRLLQDVGARPLIGAAELVAAMRRHRGSWTPSAIPRDRHPAGHEAVTLTFTPPLIVREELRPLERVTVVPLTYDVLPGEAQSAFRIVVGWLLGTHQLPLTETRQSALDHLLQGIEAHGSRGSLGMIGIPYGLPDEASAEAFAATWGLPSHRVASEAAVAEHRQRQAAVARDAAAAARAVGDDPFPALSQAVRSQATTLHQTLNDSLARRLATLVVPDAERLNDLRRRVAAFDPKHPERLQRWLRQRAPGDRPWPPAAALEALERERNTLSRAVRQIPERASPLTLHVAELERLVPSARGSSPTSGTTPDLSPLHRAPETLETAATRALAASRRLDEKTLQRLEALVQRVQAALRAGWLGDVEAQRALQRWQALAVALLSDALALTEPTARGFFDTAGALENDLWYWVASGLPRPGGLHVKRQGGLSVSSWAEGGVLFLLANPDGQSSIPADRLDRQRLSTMVFRTVVDTAESLGDLPRATLDEAWRASAALTDGLRRPAPAIALKVGLLRWRPEAVWNVRAVYAHLVSALAGRLGYPMTAAYFADEATARYTSARRGSQDGLWEPALPPPASLSEGSAPSGARVRDLVQRVSRGERVEALPLAELLAVIAHLGKDAQYQLVSIHPVSRDAEQRWVWLNGQWMAVPPAETDLAAFVQQQLRKTGRQITAWADVFGHDVRSAHGVRVQETDRGVVIEFPPFEPLVLTQMVVLQHYASPPGAVLCAMQLLEASGDARKIRVEMSAIPHPLSAAVAAGPLTRSLGAGLEERRVAPKDIRFVVWIGRRAPAAQTQSVIEAVTTARGEYHGALIFPVEDIVSFSRRVSGAGDRGGLVIAVLPSYAILNERAVDSQIAIARRRGRAVDVIAVAPPATRQRWSETLFQTTPESDSVSVFLSDADSLETAVRDRLAARLQPIAPTDASASASNAAAGLEEDRAAAEQRAVAVAEATQRLRALLDRIPGDRIVVIGPEALVWFPAIEGLRGLSDRVVVPASAAMSRGALLNILKEQDIGAFVYAGQAVGGAEMQMLADMRGLTMLDTWILDERPHVALPQLLLNLKIPRDLWDSRKTGSEQQLQQISHDLTTRWQA